MSDYLVRIITKTGNIRALACVTTDLVNEACRRHGAWPTAAAALGRALTAGTLMGALLKTHQRIALKFEGNGPLKKILVEADSNGAVRGCVGVPEVNLITPDGKLDVGGGLGKAGFLSVTKDLGMKDTYRGMVQLLSGEIAEDKLVSAAGGFLIQSLPPGDEATVDLLMEKINALPPITQLLRDGKTPEEILAILFDGIPYQILEKRALAFQCTCSKIKIEQALVSLGKEELAEMVSQKEETEVTCEYCRQVWKLTREDLERLLKEIS